jgi:sugar transferase (PEP-CTERM/EpsH1 system associated)
MNILYLAHRLPYPPNKGDKLRAFRQVEYLGRRHRVWCAAFVDDPRDFAHVEALRTHCEEVIAVPLGQSLAKIRGLAGLVRGATVTESFYRRRAMEQAVDDLARRVPFDVAVAFSSSMAAYGLRARARRRVLDLCDCDSRKWMAYAGLSHGPRRWLYRCEGERLAVREREWVRAFDASVVVTAGEARALRESGMTERVHVVGNGVELGEPAQAAGLLDLPLVGFIGVMNYFPNVDAVCWFARECWPAVLAEMPHAEFRIVGRHPVRRVRRLARLTGVEVVGEVEDARAELDRFWVSVAPLRIACGVQNKVLEAMAAGKPTVVTSAVAASLGAADGRHCLASDESDRVARAVTRLLQDAELRRRIGENGRRLAAGRFCWEDQLARFELVVTGQSRQAQAAQVEIPVGDTESSSTATCAPPPLPVA